MLTPWFMKSMTMPALVRLFQKKNTLKWSKRAVAVYINLYLTTYGKYDVKHWQICVVYFSCLKIVHTKNVHHTSPQHASIEGKFARNQEEGKLSFQWGKLSAKSIKLLVESK